MNKNLLFLVTLGVVVIVALTGFALKDRLFCRYEDSSLCEFVNTMPGSYAGVIEMPQGMQYIWKWDSLNQEILQQKQGNEVFHLIQIGEEVFVKNIPEDRWWKQSSEEVMSYGTKLMFDPNDYFISLSTALRDNETTATPLKPAYFGETPCRMYRIESDHTFDICLARGRLVMISLAENFQSSVEEAQVVVEAPQYGVIDAPRGKNTILEAMERASTVSTPSFVREFEQDRIEAEQQGDAKGPLYITPTPVESP